MFKSIRGKVNLARMLFLAGLTFSGLLLIVAALSSRPASATAGVPQTINFQGRLYGSAGATVADAIPATLNAGNSSTPGYNMRFKIYQDGDGVLGGGDETLKWTETWQNSASHGVTVKNGYFSVNLGTITSFSGIDWNQQTLWLSIDVTTTGTDTGGSPTYDGEMSPFKSLNSVPNALNSDLLDGHDFSTANTFTNTNTFSATSSAINLTGAPASGAATLLFGPALSSGSANGTYIGSNPASFSGNLVDLQVANSSVFKVDANGTLTTTGTGTSIIGTKLQTPQLVLTAAGAVAISANNYPAVNAALSYIRLGQIAIAGGNNSTNGGTWIGINSTGGSNGSGADFLNFQVGGAAALRVDNGGNFTTAGTYNSQTISSAASFTGTVNVVGALGANGGITFDQTTDTVGAHTLSGTIDANTNIITNIGNAGTDFIASTGALTLAGVLTANGGVTVAGGQDLTLSSGTGKYVQTFTGTTTDAHSITANSLQTGTALKVTSSSNTAANTAWSATQLNVTNAQGTTAVTGTNVIAGFDIQFTQAPTIAGNLNDYVANFAIAAKGTSSTDNNVAAILNLANNDTATGSQIVADKGLQITTGGTNSDITDAIYLNGTFGTNLINTSSGNFVVTQGGAATLATSITSPIHYGSSSALGTLSLISTSNATQGAIILGSGEGGSPTTTLVRGAAAAGSDIAGADLVLAASNGTGAGGSGDLIFQTAAANAASFSTPAKVQSKLGQGTGTSFNVIYGAVPTSGNTLIAVVSVNTGSETSVPSNGGNAWTLATSFPSNDATSGDNTYVYYKAANGSDSATVTFTVTNGQRAVVAMYEYSGIAASPIDQTAVANSGASAVSSQATGTTATTGTTNDLLFAVVGAENNDINTPSISWNNSFTALDYKGTAGSGATAEQIMTATRNVISTGTYSATVTWNSGAAHTAQGGIVAFKAAASSATTADSLTERLRVTAAGNVGINNSSPNSTLDVGGTINASGSVTIQGSNALTLGTSSANNAAIIFNSSGGTNTITLAAPTTNPGSSYTLNLPITAPSTSQCLQSDPSTATQLIFSSCGSGGGDSISVNGSAATDANFLDTTGTGTATGVTFTLNTAPSPDTIAISITNADATHAGAVTNGTQTLGGAKTFNSDITVQGIDTVSRNGTGTSDYTFGVTGTPVNDAASSLIRIGNAIALGNNATNGGTYIGLNEPNTSTGSAADFLNFQKNGTSKIKVDNTGTVTIAAGSSYTGAGAVTVSSGGANTLTLQSGGAAAVNIDTGGGAAINIGATNTTSFVIGGNTTATITEKIANTSTTGYTLQTAGSTKYLIVDTTNVRVQVGDTSADGTGVLLVLDTKNTSADPTGVGGGMYYNSALEQFRCYVDNPASNGYWRDCATPDADTSINLVDEFMSGPQGTPLTDITTTAAGVGSLNWTILGLASASNCSVTWNDSAGVAPTADHPGNVRLRSSSTINTGCLMFLARQTASPSWGLAANQMFKVSAVAPTGNAIAKIGLANEGANTTAPTAGVWWEADPATNANWRYCYVNGANTVTCANSTIAISNTSWTRLEARITATGTNTSSIDYYANGTKFSVSGVTLLTTTLVFPEALIYDTNTTQKDMSLDYFQIRALPSALR